MGGNLEGKNLPSFSRVKTLVSEALTETVTHILTPKRAIDVLAGVEKAKKEGRPFVMTFVGVNGVGKSTSLAKVFSFPFSSSSSFPYSPSHPLFPSRSPHGSNQMATGFSSPPAIPLDPELSNS